MVHDSHYRRGPPCGPPTFLSHFIIGKVARVLSFITMSCPLLEKSPKDHLSGLATVFIVSASLVDCQSLSHDRRAHRASLAAREATGYHLSSFGHGPCHSFCFHCLPCSPPLIVMEHHPHHHLLLASHGPHPCTDHPLHLLPIIAKPPSIHHGSSILELISLLKNKLKL